MINLYSFHIFSLRLRHPINSSKKKHFSMQQRNFLNLETKIVNKLKIYETQTHN